jgi:GxxExxY protein
MNENEIAAAVVDSAYRIHRSIGPGLFESVYHTLLCHELSKRGLIVEGEKVLSIRYDGILIPDAFRADIVVNGKVIVEIKSLETLGMVHKKQLLTYLKVSGLKLGLLINFGEATVKRGITRIVNGLEDLPQHIQT